MTTITMNKQLKKTLLIGLGAIVFFLGLSYAFVPEVLDGKIVNQGDIQHYIGMSHEMSRWNAEHPDDPTYWTGSMFSGMPTAPITVVGGGDATKLLYDALLLGYRPATYLFVALLGGFLLMLALGVDWLLAIGGAVAIGFCSYHFQIIEAGHNTKMQAIAFMPWVLAGLIWTYKVALGDPTIKSWGDENPAGGSKSSCHGLTSACGSKTSCHGITVASWWARTVLAASLFGLALSFEIKANHVQITYYLALMIALYALMMVAWVLWKHRDRLKEFLIASGLLLVLGVLGIGTNANKLLPINDYQPVSIRGGSELTASEDGQKAQNGGLNLDYMTTYSYGWNELPNLMIPNWNGGGCGARTSLKGSRTAQAFAARSEAKLRQEQVEVQQELASLSAQRQEYLNYFYQQEVLDGREPEEAERVAGQQLRQYESDLKKYDSMIRSELQQNLEEAEKTASQLMYWGPQPPTKGPLYVGCISIFLFVLGLCLYEGKEKWWLLAVTVMAALLAIGYNSDGTPYYGIQKWAANTLPMYSKFRDVKTILVLLHVALPMLGFLALDRILKKGYDRKRFLRGLGIASGACGLFLLIAATVRRSFSGPIDAQYQLEKDLVDALAADRSALLSGDLRICLVLILAVAAILLVFYLAPERKEMWLSRNRRPVAAGAIGVLILANLFTVGHRYLNEDHFITPGDFEKVYQERPVDRAIHELDPGKTARVLDLTEFASAIPSYHHRCIGGYSPAKLQRYEDLLQRYVYNGNDPTVMDALNAKYIIHSASADGLEINDGAFGPAWFVDRTLQTETPDQELEAIAYTNLWNTAILGPDFRGAAPDRLPGDETDEVELLSYAPNQMHYRYHAASERILVFSEIYHKDWKATLDGQPLELFRTDWVLRGAVVPAGEHEIIMRFDPKVYARGRGISLGSSLALLLILLLSAGGSLWLCRKR